MNTLDSKIIHHRGTEGTEKNFFMFGYAVGVTNKKLCALCASVVKSSQPS